MVDSDVRGLLSAARHLFSGCGGRRPCACLACCPEASALTLPALSSSPRRLRQQTSWGWALRPPCPPDRHPPLAGCSWTFSQTHPPRSLPWLPAPRTTSPGSLPPASQGQGLPPPPPGLRPGRPALREEGGSGSGRVRERRPACSLLLWAAPALQDACTLLSVLCPWALWSRPVSALQAASFFF